MQAGGEERDAGSVERFMLLLPGIQPDANVPQLAEAKGAGIAMPSPGSMSIARYGIAASLVGQGLSERDPRVVQSGRWGNGKCPAAVAESGFLRPRS